MKTFGLIGFPLSHSFSKKFFTEKFDREGHSDACQYKLFPIEDVRMLPDLIAGDPSLHGLNVTIPHKVSVLPFMDAMDEAAARIGAVNCISAREQQGRKWLSGYNTDAYGFEMSLRPLLQPHHTKALVLGDGGAARAVRYVLEKLNISFIAVVRNPVPGAVLYQDLTRDQLDTHQLLINTTPLGTFPKVDGAPAIPYEWLSDKHLAYDLVYNPEVTTFLKLAKAAGATIKNGYEMLELQAERSWQIWNT